MQSENQSRLDIVEVGRRIYKQGFVASNDGNISVKISRDRILCTPHGVSKGFMTSDNISTVDSKGNLITGLWKPTSELFMHLEVYKNRYDVGAVVHAHPPTVTGFAVAGIPLNSRLMPEMVINVGEIPFCAYGTPSTQEIVDSIRPYLDQHDAFLLANHGAMTLGRDVFDAYYKMESLELLAKVTLIARQLGGEKQLTNKQVQCLLEMRKNNNG